MGIKSKNLQKLINILGKETGVLELMPEDVENAMDSLIKKGKAAVADLLAVLNSQEIKETAIRHILYILGQIKDGRAMRTLSDFLGHFNPVIKIEAIKALGRFSAKELKEVNVGQAIMQAASDVDVNVREQATKLYNKLDIKVSGKPWYYGVAKWEEIAEAFTKYEIIKAKPDFKILKQLLEPFIDQYKHAACHRIGLAFRNKNKITMTRCLLQGLVYDPDPESANWLHLDFALFNDPKIKKLQEQIKRYPCRASEANEQEVKTIIGELVRVCGLPE
jgi:hypothetical protein